MEASFVVTFVRSTLRSYQLPTMKQITLQNSGKGVDIVLKTMGVRRAVVNFVSPVNIRTLIII